MPVGCVCVCQCVFIHRGGFNVFLRDGGSFFFFFLEGGMSSVRRFSPLKGGEREDAWRDEHCHSLCVLHVCFLLERLDEQVKVVSFLANACRFRALWSSEGV